MNFHAITCGENYSTRSKKNQGICSGISHRWVWMNLECVLCNAGEEKCRIQTCISALLWQITAPLPERKVSFEEHLYAAWNMKINKLPISVWQYTENNALLLGEFLETRAKCVLGGNFLCATSLPGRSNSLHGIGGCGCAQRAPQPEQLLSCEVVEEQGW